MAEEEGKDMEQDFSPGSAGAEAGAAEVSSAAVEASGGSADETASAADEDAEQAEAEAEQHGEPQGEQIADPAAADEALPDDDAHSQHSISSADLPHESDSEEEAADTADGQPLQDEAQPAAQPADAEPVQEAQATIAGQAESQPQAAAAIADALSALEEAETGAPPLEQTATVTVQQEIEAPFAPIRAATPVRQLQFASGNYRPTSVEIAAQIEGFDDDFKQAGGFLPEVAEGRDEAAADGGHFYDDDEEPESNLEDLIAQAEAQKAVLAIENVGLHQRVRQVLDARNKGRPAPYRDSAKLHGLDARYQSLLSTWGKLLEEQERLSSHFQAATLDLRAQLAERIGRSDDLRNTFHHFLMEVAKSAENSKSGRPIPPKVLADLAAADAGREGEVQKVRLKNIHLRNQLHKLEASVKQKEELAEGLHLIDFEQLKIENQSLNEKIEERCEELLKLRKKTTQTVQVLTHVKEKLQFVQKENTVLQGQLAEVEGAMADERDELSRVKGQRDRHKQRWHRLKETSSHINAPQLLEDIQGQRVRRDTLDSQVAALQTQHASITQRTAEMTTQIMAMSADVQAHMNAAPMSCSRGGLTPFTPAATTPAPLLSVKSPVQ